MDAIALLLAATAKVDGDISSEEKGELKKIFEDTFNQTPQEASALLVSSTYLLNHRDDILGRPEEVLARSLPKFTESQRSSSAELFTRISLVGGAASESQKELVEKIRAILIPENSRKNW